MSKVYLAGRMTGLPQFNFPRFIEVADDLRFLGYDVVSPAEIDDGETAAAGMASEDGSPCERTGEVNNQTWGDFLSRDVKIVADEVTGVVLMDDWYASRGANLEAFVGLLCGRDFYAYRNGILYAISAVAVWAQLQQQGCLSEMQDAVEEYIRGQS